ncbi:response regulator transcription factor [Stappia sp. MMSF_3263]|uniref:response regulator n=1 Tax=Stappia sp. MMSF_3263 TaxID=3046693 RepID=UPI00273F3C60|nr:response regulator transcription factor [Stappia sp. MMSF_3263]
MTADADTMTKFLIIDDHPLFREALHSAVTLAYPDAETLDAASLPEACDILEGESGFDLALLDLNIPGVRGMDGLLHLRTHFPRLPVVVVSGHEDPRVVSQVIAYGAAGFIPKSSKKAALADAIQKVINGAVFVPENLAAAGEAQLGAHARAMIDRVSSLTPQQLRVLGMIRDGLLNKQIAYELQVGETTVKAHVSEILRKLGVHSRTQAVIEMSRLDQISDLDPADPFGNAVG